MNINQRIKYLRKTLGLNQAKFGEKIGVSRQAASWTERTGSNIIEQNIRLICTTFGVSENWLRDGNGEMYANYSDSIMAQLTEAYSLDDVQAATVRAFLRLSPEKRRAIINGFSDLVNALKAEMPDAPQQKTQEDSYCFAGAHRKETEEEYRARLHRELDAQLDDEKKAAEKLSAFSSHTDGNLGIYRRIND